MSVLHDLVPSVLRFLHAYLLPTLFTLLLIEESGVPIPVPGDVLILLAGTLTTGWPIGFSLAVVGVCSAAVVAGSSLLFLLMHHGGRALLQRYGRLLRLGPTQLARAEHWFTDRGRLAIVLGRFIPGLRIPTTALAGLSGISYRAFAPNIAVAAMLWSLGYFWLGVLLGQQGARVASLVAVARAVVPTWLLVLGALGVGGSIGAGLWQRHRVQRALRQVRGAHE